MDDSQATALVRLWEKGGHDLETLVSAARAAWWAWDAVNVIAPERLTFPRPKRPRGRDAVVNKVRDIRIWGEVEILRSMGRSWRKACAEIAETHPMLTAKAVEAIHSKVRRGA